jgi:hypothetical protein
LELSIPTGVVKLMEVGLNAGRLGADVAGAAGCEENMALGDAKADEKRELDVEGCEAALEENWKGFVRAVLDVNAKEVEGGRKPEEADVVASGAVTGATVTAVTGAAIAGATIGTDDACLLLKTPDLLLLPNTNPPLLLFPKLLLNPPNDWFGVRFPTAGGPFAGGKLCVGARLFDDAKLFAGDPNWNMPPPCAGSCAFFSAAAAPKLNCGVALKDVACAAAPNDAGGAAPKDVAGEAPKDAGGAAPKEGVGVELNAAVAGDGAPLAPGAGKRRFGVLILIARSAHATR